MTDQLQMIDELRGEAIAAAIELFEGDRQAAGAWLSQPLRAIGYEAPLVYMDSPERIQTVQNIIGRLEHGIWT